jgi:hypothetical protein
MDLKAFFGRWGKKAAQEKTDELRDLCSGESCVDLIKPKSESERQRDMRTSLVIGLEREQKKIEEQKKALREAREALDSALTSPLLGTNDIKDAIIKYSANLRLFTIEEIERDLVNLQDVRSLGYRVDNKLEKAISHLSTYRAELRSMDVDYDDVGDLPDKCRAVSTLLGSVVELLNEARGEATKFTKKA